ncbi:3-hydroxyacyl-CoA dehydrogenase [Platysternon megacephalum]|uniref:3-hydroxyacyl-CoA dehydrogenase n=1 Tax=Platysternon megacephalum TaxID=55544 RepID=A0A4D9DGK9_9SAUR|nr:3-hydroxyacyl-CoA dehydrogenase [Platysternon megacephalum]
MAPSALQGDVGGSAGQLDPPGLSLSPALARPALAQEVQMENMTVVEGGVAEINCRLHRYDGSIVVIQNPARQTLFFNGTRGEGPPG